VNARKGDRSRGKNPGEIEASEGPLWGAVHLIDSSIAGTGDLKVKVLSGAP